MTSNMKVPTNKSTGGGPKTQAGKRRTRLNALREGFFSKELVLKEDEQSLSDAMRAALQAQYAPSTPMQWIAFDRINLCTWRVKRAAQREIRRLSADLELQSPSNLLPKDEEEQQDEPPAWYAGGRAELRAGLRFLWRLRQEIQSTHRFDAEGWKEPLTKFFGSDFYDALSQWAPRNLDAILLAEHLLGHAEAYKMPVPAELYTNKIAATSDAHTQEEMTLKLIDLMVQHVNHLRWVLDQRSVKGDLQTASGEDGRYLASACRDLERAVAWYQHLQEQGL